MEKLLWQFDVPDLVRDLVTRGSRDTLSPLVSFGLLPPQLTLPRFLDPEAFEGIPLLPLEHVGCLRAVLLSWVVDDRAVVYECYTRHGDWWLHTVGRDAHCVLARSAPAQRLGSLRLTRQQLVARGGVAVQTLLCPDGEPPLLPLVPLLTTEGWQDALTALVLEGLGRLGGRYALCLDDSAGDVVHVQLLPRRDTYRVLSPVPLKYRAAHVLFRNTVRSLESPLAFAAVSSFLARIY